MKIISHAQNENSIELLLDAGKIRLQVWDSRVIHVQYTLQRILQQPAQLDGSGPAERNHPLSP